MTGLGHTAFGPSEGRLGFGAAGAGPPRGVLCRPRRGHRRAGSPPPPASRFLASWARRGASALVFVDITPALEGGTGQVAPDQGSGCPAVWVGPPQPTDSPARSLESGTGVWGWGPVPRGAGPAPELRPEGVRTLRPPAVFWPDLGVCEPRQDAAPSTPSLGRACHTAPQPAPGSPLPCGGWAPAAHAGLWPAGEAEGERRGPEVLPACGPRPGRAGLGRAAAGAGRGAAGGQRLRLGRQGRV